MKMHISIISDHNTTWYKPEFLKQLEAERIAADITLYQYDPNIKMLTTKAYESDIIFIYIENSKRLDIENIQKLADKTKGYIIVNNILNYEFPSFGRSNIIIYDLQRFYQKYGAINIEHTALRYINDMILTPRYVTKLIHEYIGYVKAYLGLSKKCIVLDLDNTLYEGIIGENTMRLDDTPGCARYLHLQRILLKLYKKGIVLAVCSKNNYEDAIEALNHPKMLIKEEHLACIKANWKPKSENIISIAEEINLTTDSLVLIDDNSIEIERE